MSHDYLTSSDNKSPQWTSAGRQVFRAAISGAAISGAGVLTGPSRGEALLDLVLPLVDHGLNSKSYKALTSTLRKFLKHLDGQFELRYLQNLPEVAEKTRWAADEQRSPGARLVADGLAEAIAEVFAPPPGGPLLAALLEQRSQWPADCRPRRDLGRSRMTEPPSAPPLATRVLVVDNDDSFTYNLVQDLGRLGADLRVFRKRAIDVKGLARLDPSHLVISPGPGHPRDAELSIAAMRHFAGQIPILGVCLGHQCLGLVSGAQIVHAPRLMHGKTSRIWHSDQGVFRGLPQGFSAMRYHSLIVDRNTLPGCLEVTAWTDADEIMGLRHRLIPGFEGVQFHPESFLTEGGRQLLANFLATVRS